MKILWLIISTHCIASISLAGEIPSFRCAHELRHNNALQQSATVAKIDQFTNSQIRKAVDKANAAADPQKGLFEALKRFASKTLPIPPAPEESEPSVPLKCDPKFIFLALEDLLGNRSIGQVEHFVDEDLQQTYKCTKNYNASIFSHDLSKEQSETPNFPLFHNTRLSSIVKICGTNVGADKFGHFMGQGFDYFIRALRDGEKAALDWGIKSEDTFYGLSSYGIKSYGDLAANYEGFGFWNNVYDFSGSNPKSQITCENGKFKVKKQFQWCDYVSKAWDQTVNCSVYVRDVHDVVTRNQKTLTKALKAPMQCPTSVDQCQDIIRQYKRKLGSRYEAQKNAVLSPKCLVYESGIVAPSNEEFVIEQEKGVSR